MTPERQRYTDVAFINGSKEYHLTRVPLNCRLWAVPHLPVG